MSDYAQDNPSAGLLTVSYINHRPSPIYVHTQGSGPASCPSKPTLTLRPKSGTQNSTQWLEPTLTFSESPRPVQIYHRPVPGEPPRPGQGSPSHTRSWTPSAPSLVPVWLVSLGEGKGPARSLPAQGT